jgi:hypothetical protein
MKANVRSLDVVSRLVVNVDQHIDLLPSAETLFVQRNLEGGRSTKQKIFLHFLMDGFLQWRYGLKLSVRKKKWLIEWNTFAREGSIWSGVGTLCTNPLDLSTTKTAEAKYSIRALYPFPLADLDGIASPFFPLVETGNEKGTW